MPLFLKTVILYHKFINKYKCFYNYLSSIIFFNLLILLKSKVHISFILLNQLDNITFISSF